MGESAQREPAPLHMGRRSETPDPVHLPVPPFPVLIRVSIFWIPQSPSPSVAPPHLKFKAGFVLSCLPSRREAHPFHYRFSALKKTNKQTNKAPYRF